MKKLLLKLAIIVAIVLSLNACSPIFYDSDDVVVDYYIPGYYLYEGHYHSRPYREHNSRPRQRRPSRNDNQSHNDRRSHNDRQSDRK